MTDRSNPASREASLRRKKGQSGYHYRRRSKITLSDQYHAELKHVLGLTLKSNCAFACDPSTGLLAYPAGCVIVLYEPRSEKQSHIFNPGQKTLTCLRFSNDGNFIVTGEAGHQPCVRVFSVSDLCHMISFQSHKYGISSVSFSPNGKYVISIGYQHDNVINVWDWKKDNLVASNKVSTKIKAVAFAEDSSYFVTVGNRHVKFWYLENSSADKTTIPLKGRSAILESLRNHIFCDVVCAIGSESTLTFAVTRSGILCQFNAGRTVEKSVELKCGTARSICIIDDMILCGSASGSVHVFNLNSLEFITEVLPPQQVSGQEVIAMAIDIQNMWMHCVYSGHSFIIYDVMSMDFSSLPIHALFQFHNSCVWDVKTLPATSESDSLPSDCFLTCSNDGSTRAWKFEGTDCELVKLLKLGDSMEKKKDDSGTKYEARSLCIRYDAKHLAVGDRAGNIHIYDLETFEKIAFIPTHEGDILCMDYAKSGDILASASRDRCVHTFDGGYSPTHTVADHSAAVTSVKFAHQGNDFRLVTCGSDKSLYFCSITSNGGKTEISREQHIVEKHSMSDMAVLDDSVLVACGSNLGEYDIIGGKLRRTFRGNESTATILRVAVDNQRTLIATSCADKHIYVLGFMTTECLCILSGHSEVGLALTFDQEDRLLSASADSCVFVWVLNHRVQDDTRNIQPQNSNTSASAVETTDHNKTAYFNTSANTTLLPEMVEPIDYANTAERDSLLAMYSGDVDDNDIKMTTFEAVCDTMASPQVFGLPKWVTQTLSADSESEVTPSHKPALGKWGDKLELEKVCEEIGNLAKSSDVGSIISSVDEEELSSDEEDEENTHSVLEDNNISAIHPDDPSRQKETLTPEQSGDSDDTVNNSSEDSSVLDNGEHLGSSNLTTNSPQFTAQGQAEHNGFCNTDEPCKEISPEMDTRDMNKENELAEVRRLSAKYLNKSELIFEQIQGDKRNSLSFQDELANLNGHAAGNVTPLTPRNTESQSKLNAAGPTKVRRKSLPPIPHHHHTHAVNPGRASDHITSSADVVDEDIDMRKVLYSLKSVANQNSGNFGQAKPLYNKNIRVELSGAEDIPVALSTFNLNLQQNASNTEVNFSKNNDNYNEDFSSNQALQPTEEQVDIASRDLVEKVLKSVEDSNESCSEDGKSGDFVDQHQSKQHSNELHDSLNELPDNERNGFAENGNEHDDIEATLTPRKAGMNITKLTAIACSTPVTKSSKMDNRNKDAIVPQSVTREEKAQHNSKGALESKKNSQAMPPAFVELLASLTKKRNSKIHPADSVKSLPVRSQEDEESLQRPVIPEAGDQNRYEDDNLPFNGNCNEVENNNNKYPSTESYDKWQDDQLECQKASEDLIAVFSHAEAVYKRQKANHDADLANGNHVGFHKLLHTFQTVHSRINRLKINTVHPEQSGKLVARSASLENLGDDSPVVSLLREYSDRLVDLVHSQVDNRNVLATQADTV